MVFTIAFKTELLKTCKKIIQARIDNANHAMNAAQEAANGEDKSSAGDKYETSRAMGHRDRDMYARQLVEAKNEWQKIDKINLEPSAIIKAGSLIEANETYYFIATGIGKVEVNGQMVMVISKESPIANLMLNKKINDAFSFNNKLWKITGLI